MTVVTDAEYSPTPCMLAWGWWLLPMLGLIWGCNDGQYEREPPDAKSDAVVSPVTDSESFDDAFPSSDMRLPRDMALDTPDTFDADRDSGGDTAVWADPFQLTDLPARDDPEQYLLSQTGLFQDILTGDFHPEAQHYSPRHQLWSDGTEKRRWVILPPVGQIDNEDQDQWLMPVGTRFFKEFSKNGVRLETRLIVRTGSGVRDYWMGSFLWDADQEDAVFVPDGAENVHGTDHDVPEVKACGTCHNGSRGRALGFGSVQLGPSQEQIWSALLDENRLTHDQSVLQMLPGSESEQAVLGYLHANCAHCHNAQGSAWPDTDIELGLSVNDTLPETTAAYRTSIGQALQYFNAEPGVVRLMPGDPERSAIYLRMAQRGLETQMPPLATKHVDEVGLALIENWIRAFPAAPQND